MGFITSLERLSKYKQSKGKLFVILDNQLFEDEDKRIYLVPRNFVTDNYSIPNCLAWLVGDSAERELRPSWLHDFGCAYKQLIEVNLTKTELSTKGFLEFHNTDHNGVVISCKDIPKEYLSLRDVGKKEINDIFARAMAPFNIPKQKLIRIGVAFNFNFYKKTKPYNFDNLYEVDNHYENKY